MAEIILKIEKITMLASKSGADVLYIHTNLPDPMPNLCGGDNVRIRLDVEHGKGYKYAVDNFGVKPEIINTGD
jgi:hypothetical protein